MRINMRFICLIGVIVNIALINTSLGLLRNMTWGKMSSLKSAKIPVGF